MNRLGITFVLMFSLAWKLSVASAQIRTWERQYGKPNRAEFAWDIVETSENNFVVCGITLGSVPWDLDGWIISINSNGDTLWTRQIGSMGIGAGQDFLTCVILNDRGELVLTGNRYQFPYSKQVWFLKFNTNGDLLVEKRFGGKLEDNGNKIIQNQDGSYFLIGDTQSFGTQHGGKDIWLLKLTADGDTLWTKTYDLGFIDMATGIIPVNENQYLIIAVSCTANCGDMFQKGFATYFVIDSVGNILRTRSFSEGPKNKFLHISPTNDGGAIITGATSLREKFPSEDVWIMKLDANFDTVWTKTIGGYGRYDGGHSIVQSSDGGYYLAAYTQTFQSPEMDFDNWWLLRLNATGDTLWTRRWGGPLNDDPYAIRLTSDGGIIMAGWRDANSNPFYSLSIGDAKFYVIKTDTMGLVSGLTDISSQPPLRFELYQNYPNPFNQSTLIRYQLSEESQVVLSIYDLLGHRLETLVTGRQPAGSHDVQWNASGFASGVYIYRLESKHFSQAKKLVLIR